MAGAGRRRVVALAWEYADGKTNDAQARDVDVDRAVARVFAARARQEATALNRGGDYVRRAAALAGVAKRIRSYAGRDPEMRALVGELESRFAEVAAPMAEASRKQMFFASYNVGQVPHASTAKPPASHNRCVVP